MFPSPFGKGAVCLRRGAMCKIYAYIFTSQDVLGWRLDCLAYPVSYMIDDWKMKNGTLACALSRADVEGGDSLKGASRILGISSLLISIAFPALAEDLHLISTLATV
jgi:hypothetical protein